MKPVSTCPVRVAICAWVSTVGKGQDPGLQFDELRQVAALLVHHDRVRRRWDQRLRRVTSRA